MDVSSWSVNPDLNAVADPDLPAMDGASSRKLASFIRQLMAGVAQVSKGTAAIGHRAVPDLDYQATATDTQIGFPVLSAPRTVFLPDVDTFPLGQVLFIADESGDCSVDRPITIAVGAGTNDTIAGQQNFQITDRYQGIGLRRGAANVWIIAR